MPEYPFTPVELNLACEIARAIMQDDVAFTNGFGVNNTLTGVSLMLDSVLGYLNSLDDSHIQCVRDCINRYKPVRFENFVLQEDVGVVHGISVSAEKQRERIRDVFLLYVPMYEFFEGMKKRGKAIEGDDDSVGRIEGR